MAVQSTDTEKQPSLSSLQSLSDLNAPFWSNARQLAAWCIGTNEHLAKGLLEVQEQNMQWAKDTPWASLLHAQTDVARQWVEGSAQMARRLWRIKESSEEKRTHAEEETEQRPAAS